MTKVSNDWYTSWFNTPFYHILYKDRGYDEAQSFMNILIAYLNIPEQAHILDLACGKGRHSIHLNSMGYEVTGLDLSEQSIAIARQYENQRLHFEVHDMSEPYPKKFDLVLNLFTSFGYFEDFTDNFRTIRAIKESLNHTGIGVIDFLNVDYLTDHLVTQDVKTVNDITFHQKRYLDNGFLVKEIVFEINKKPFYFEERVMALTLEDFRNMFENAGLQLLDIFGDYKLGPYNKNTSERLVMIFTLAHE